MGVAILSVLIAHIGKPENLPSILSILYDVLVYGTFTMCFLFLSGFGLYYSFKRNNNLRDFYRKRLLRVYIPFVLISLPFFVFTDICVLKDFKSFLFHISTIDFWINGNFYGMWYVAYSLVLYLLFPLFFKVIFCCKKGIFIRVLFLLSLLIVIRYILLKTSPDYYQKIHIGLDITNCFILGIYWGYLSDHHKQYSILVGGGNLILIILLYAVRRYTMFFNGEYSLVLMFFCVMLWALVFHNSDKLLNNSWFAQAFRWLGAHSLEIYILHLLSFHLLFDYLFPSINRSFAFAVSDCFAIAVCHPVQVCVNKLVCTIRQ